MSGFTQPPSHGIDLASNLASHCGKLSVDQVVHHVVVADLDVDDRRPAERPPIGHLAARFGIERRAIEHERRLSFPARMPDDPRLEGEEQRIVVVKSRCHAIPYLPRPESSYGERRMRRRVVGPM